MRTEDITRYLSVGQRRVNVSQLRKVDVIDLLGRDPIAVDLTRLCVYAG